MRFLVFSSLLFVWASIGSSCTSSPAKPAPVKDSVPPFDSTPIIYQQIHGAEKAARIDSIFSAMAKEDRFNGSVLIAQRGVIVYQKAFGWFNYEKRDSLSTETSFQLASVSKQFTASAIMLLHQQGKLNYDDWVNKYLPDFPYSGITIRHLLNHRSGLSRYTDMCDEYYRGLNREPESYTNDSVLALMNQLKPPPFKKPNEKFKYSNTGYVILASIVEKISQQKFPAFMKENFFDTLGMTHTWVNDDPKNKTGKPIAYFRRWERWDENYLDGTTGDKGVFSSPADLFLWDRSLKNYTILKKDILEEAYQPGSPELAEKEYWNYGFGWRIINFPEDGARAVFHNGWWHGYTTSFYRGLTDDVTVIILCNKFNRAIYHIQPLLRILGAHSIALPDDDALSTSDTAQTDAKNKKQPAKKSGHAKTKHRH